MVLTISVSTSRSKIDSMEWEGLSQADTACRLGFTQRKGNQWLALPMLPQVQKKRILAMGDRWERRVVTGGG